MANFMEWLRLHELTSLSHIDSSGVELDEVEGGYEHRFGQIRVQLKRAASEVVGGRIVDGIWGVTFSNNGGYFLTGDSGGDAVRVYAGVLAALKRLTEVEEVNGLYFSGAEPRQDLMYDRLLRALGGFTPAGEYLYLRDGLVKHFATDAERASYASHGAQRDSRLHNLRVAKSASRSRGLPGKITGLRTYHGRVIPAIVLEALQSLKVVVVKWDEGDFHRKVVEADELHTLVSPALIKPDDLAQLMEDIRNPVSMLSMMLKVQYPEAVVDGSTHDFGFRQPT